MDSMMLSATYNLLAAGTFARPWWLAAIVVTAVPAGVAALGRWRGRQIAGFSVVLQSLAIALVAVALAGPSVPLGGDASKAWLILNDVSASTRDQHPSRYTLDLDSLGPHLEYVFAASVAPKGQDIDDSRTDIAAPLRLAAARAGELAGVIIRTDGRFTDDKWASAAEALARTGLRPAIVPLDRPPRDVRITEFIATRTDAGKVTLRLSVAANAMVSSPVEIRGSEDKVLLRRDVNFLPDEPVTVSVSDTVAEDRGAVYHAAVLKEDAFGENDRATAAVGPVVRRVALVSAPGGYKPSNLASLLGMPVNAVGPQAKLGDYAAVIVVDDTGRLLSPQQRSSAARYVRSGGGLVILGAGPHESPADNLDPINQVAALVPNPYNRRPLRLTVVLDASGSMGRPAESATQRLMKFDQAIEAVLSLKRHLTDRDTLRVIVFSDRAKEVYTSGGERPDFSKLAEAIRQVKPRGATNVFPALKLAAEAATAGPGRGMVLLVSDLQTERFDPPAAAKMLEDAKLDLAIVAIAAPGATPATDPLEALAKLVRAPLEKRDHLVGLAKVFAGFLRTARGLAVRTGQFTLTHRKPGLDSRALAGKPLDAYILSAPAKDADVMLSAGSDAVVASRTVGLGRSVSIALATSNNANRALLQTPEFAEMLAAAAKWAARPGPDSRYSGEISRSAGEVIVTLRAADDSGPINNANLRLGLLDPSRETARSIDMLQVGPGLYEARFAPGPAAFHATGAGGRVVWRGALPRTHPPEFDAIGPDRAQLQRLATLTGGQLVEPGDLADLTAQKRDAGKTDLWPFLAGLALVLMLTDWLVSRTVHTSANSSES